MSKPAARLLRGAVCAVLCILLCAASSVSSAQEQKPRDAGQISMDFQDVDIRVLIKFIGELTGRNFIVDKSVVGKVSVLSPTPVSVGEAYEIFNSVLQVNGFTTIPSGKVIKIVPMNKALDDGVATSSSRANVAGPGGSFITQIVPLTYADAQELVRAVAPMVVKGGLASAYIPANSLIVSDYASNVDRILKIVRTLDQHMYGKSLVAVSLENGRAKDVAEKAEKVLASTMSVNREVGAGQQSSLVVSYDDRTNTVLALVPPEQENTLRELVAALDVPTPRGKGDVHLVYLENANAEEAAKVLTSLVQGQTLEDGKTVLSRDVKVVADKGTNSLLVSADASEFQILAETIAKLDIKRRQVFVEALIMEVSTDQNFSFGVNWAGGGSTDHGVFFGSANPGGGTIGTDSNGNTTYPAGGSIGFVQFPISIGGLTLNSLQSVISFSEGSNDFNVIATPQLLTLDNEEATVTVAENIPYSTQVDSGTSTTDKSVQSFDYRDVGVILKMTPQIGEGSTVRLKIHQEVSRVVNQLVTNSANDYVILAPTTRKREVDTSVQVDNGQTIVIAGLLENEKQVNESRVPGLGDIPLIGNLFKYKQTTDGKKNLYVFLTPRIVDNRQDAESINHEKRRNILAAQVGSDGVAGPRISPQSAAGLRPVVPQ